MANIPTNCKVGIGDQEIALLIVHPDQSLSYAPIVDGAFQTPQLADRTHLVLIRDGKAEALPTKRCQLDGPDIEYQPPDLP